MGAIHGAQILTSTANRGSRKRRSSHATFSSQPRPVWAAQLSRVRPFLLHPPGREPASRRLMPGGSDETLCHLRLRHRLLRRVLRHLSLCHRLHRRPAGHFPRSIDGEPLLPSGQALAIDLLLLTLFAVQHSVMARPAFKAVWTRIIPTAAERSTYVLFSSLALIALFRFWQPLGGQVWSRSEE